MASTANNFSMLIGAEQQVASSKKKKANKAKAAAPAAGGAPAPAQPAQPAASAAEQMAALSVSGNVVVEVDEAKAIFERAAREAKSSGDKGKLWKDWTRQATDRSGKGMKFKDTDGSFMDFKQVILRSRALEITVESCVSSALTAERQGTLVQLLGAFLPADQGTIEGLAASLVRLSGLLADESPDTLMAAQRAVSSTIAAMKSSGAGSESESSPIAAWLSRVQAIDKEIARQQGMLQKLVVTNKGSITRETTICAKALVKLQEEKFDLLQPQSVPVAKAPSGLLGAGLKSLDELRAVINSHIGKDGDAKGASSSKNTSTFKREEELLHQQANEVGAEIRKLEAQLRSLRAQQQEIHDKMGQINQRSSSSWESAGGKAKQQVGLSANHYREELMVVDTIKSLVDPSSRAGGASAEQVSAVRAAQFDAPVSYASNSEQFLGMALKALAEVPSKINFCRQRIDKATKLAQLGAAVGDKLVQDSKRQCDEAEKLLADTMRMAEELVSTSVQVRGDVHSRYDAMVRFNADGAKAVGQHMRTIDSLAQQVQQQYSAILTGTAAPAAPAAAAAAPSAASYTPPASLAASTAAPAARAAAGGRGPRPASAAPQATASKPAANGAAAAASAPAAAAPAPARPVSAAPAKSWGKLETPVASGDAALPTPAEAFKVAGSSNDDGFTSAGAKKSNARKPKA